MQSSSVTPGGFLWLETLARMANDAPFTVSQSDIKDKELHQSAVQRQKNRALIQLLRSWREGDEQGVEERQLDGMVGVARIGGLDGLDMGDGESSDAGAHGAARTSTAAETFA